MAVNEALILDPTGLPRRRVPGTPGPAAGSRGGHLPPRTPQAGGRRGETSPDRQGLCWTVRLSLLLNYNFTGKWHLSYLLCYHITQHF